MDTVPPNNYTIKDRSESLQCNMYSMGLGPKLIIQTPVKAMFLKFKSEFVFNFYTRKSYRSNATNRLVVEIALGMNL